MLIIETGSGLPDADSYITATDAQDAAGLVVSYPLIVAAELSNLEKHLRTAYQWIARLEDQLSGRRTVAEQSGAFPRSRCLRRAGGLVGSDEIPPEVIAAQLAATEASLGGRSLFGVGSPSAAAPSRIEVTGAHGVGYVRQGGTGGGAPLSASGDDAAYRILTPFRRAVSRWGAGA